MRLRVASSRFTLAIRELRDLTRYRLNLAQECNRIANRIQKVLEDANIKLASVATDALGASGRAMLKAIITGEQDVEKLADLSRGLLRRKIPELQLALEGYVSQHHRFLLTELIKHLEFIECKMMRLEQEIADRLGPFEDTGRRLWTVDRSSVRGALSPRSVLTCISSRMPNTWPVGRPLSGQLGERGQTEDWKDSQEALGYDAISAIGVGRLHQAEQLPLRSLPAASRASRRQACTIAVAHALLCIAYRILRDPVEYRDLGPDYFDKLHPVRLKNRLVKRLEGLGFQITLAPTPDLESIFEGIGLPEE